MQTQELRTAISFFMIFLQHNDVDLNVLFTDPKSHIDAFMLEWGNKLVDSTR